MKPVRNIAAAALLTIGAFGLVTFTSCTKESDKCPAGYEGKKCDERIVEKYIGEWRTDREDCTENTPGYDIVIKLSSSGDDKMIITNLYNANYNAIARVTGSSTFVIDGQSFGSGNRINGTGSLIEDEIFISYTVENVDKGTKDACTNVQFYRF